MIERRPRTHTLTVTVPLHLEEGETFDYDPIHDALRLVVSLSRLATDGVLCDDIGVHLDYADGRIGWPVGNAGAAR